LLEEAGPACSIVSCQAVLASPGVLGRVSKEENAVKSSWFSECQLRSRCFETFIPVGSRALLGKAKFEYKGLIPSRTTFRNFTWSIVMSCLK